MTPLVSIVIPVFNVEQYLGKCLDSILGQTLKDIEVICINDGSTDSSGAILREYAGKDGRIRLEEQENSGAGCARNRGLALASGKYVIFIDPDDWCLPDMMRGMSQVAERDNADVVICGVQRYDESSGTIVSVRRFSEELMSLSQPFSAEMIAHGIFLRFEHSPWNKLWRRQFVNELGFQFQPNPRANDLFFIDSSLSCARRISLVNSPYYCYRIARAGSSQNTNDKTPLMFCKAYKALKEVLVERGTWETFRVCFCRAVFSSMVFTLKSLHRAEVLKAAYEELRSKWMQYFELPRMTRADFRDDAVFQSYEIMIEDPDPIRFMMHELHREQAAVKRTGAQVQKCTMEVSTQKNFASKARDRFFPLMGLKVLFSGSSGMQPGNNPFVGTLGKALVQLGAEVTYGINHLKEERHFDIIHMMWPESLYGWDAEAASEEGCNRLKDMLATAKDKGSKVVYTRHNLMPHQYANPVALNYYSAIEGAADMVLHMGEFSRKEFVDSHPATKSMQKVIPHHLYDNIIKKNITMAEARGWLGLSESDVVVLCFGIFRSDAERELVVSAVKGLKNENVKVLAPKFNGVSDEIPLITLPPGGFVPEVVLPVYFAAADIVFIQRKSILNSGNLPMAFYFGKICVGPDCGNVGEILSASGNPVFDPDDVESAVAALRKAVELRDSDLGVRNRKLAESQWNSARIARLTADAYLEVLGKSHVKRDNGSCDSKRLLSECGRMMSEIDRLRVSNADKTKKEAWLRSRLSDTQKRLRGAESNAKKYASEVSALKKSEAYRMGMFVTWPFRKTIKAVKCLRKGTADR